MTGAVCNPPEVWQMVDELLIAQEKWLPQYYREIQKIKEGWQVDRLIPTNDNYKGAVRFKAKTPEQVQAERDNRKITV